MKIEDLPTDYYSSDDHSSDSGEDSDHLNKLSPLQVVTSMNREGYLQTNRLNWHSSQIVRQSQYMQGML